MDLNCKLIEKTFTTDDGQSRSYTAIRFNLADGSNLDIAIKGDKARLLKLSNGVKFPEIDKDIWEDR